MVYMMHQFNHTSACPYDGFSKRMEAKVLQINALLMVNVVLAFLIVGIGAYGGQRYRHRSFTRLLYRGANVLFVPIMSYTISAFRNLDVTGFMSDKTPIVAFCNTGSQTIAVLHIASLVEVIAINTSTLVVGDDREGRNIGPPFILFLQTLWTSFLAFYISGYSPFTHGFSLDGAIRGIKEGIGSILFPPFVIIYVKMVLKLCAFYFTRRSYALARNPRVIVGYMHSYKGSHHGVLEPPPLLVMGEENMHVENQPYGSCFIWMSEEKKKLVTLDKVFLSSTTHEMKDLCFSFSLFKMLRCRFASYGIAEVRFNKVFNFFWHVLLSKDDNGERVLGVITDELSFLYDYYYSSLPTSYSNHWLVIMNILISIISMSYFLCRGISAVVTLVVLAFSREERCISPVSCDVQCDGTSGEPYHFGSFGNLVLPSAFLLALIVLTEAKEIVSYVCSKWTKVALICCYIKHGSLRSTIMKKCISVILRCRCEILTHWEDKSYQASILLRPRKITSLLQRFIPQLPGQKKNMKVPREVKVAVLNTLRSYEGSRSNCVASLHQHLQVGNRLHWTFNGKGTADTMLVYHIATSVFEVRSHSDQPPSKYKVAATHLSQYCSYLVAYRPELLPDDDDWCKSLYKAVKKDAECILISKIAATTAEAGYQQLVEMLDAGSKHEVLKRGVELGKLLGGLVEVEEMVWEALAAFWSEIILYAAPSDNINGHLEAVARGGELITLLWALLMHVGIVNRPEATAAATDGVGAPADEALKDHVAGTAVDTLCSLNDNSRVNVSEDVMTNAYQRQAVPGTSGEIIMEIIDTEDGGNDAQEK